jgi:xylulose-5-phosphate/fructose-6-phosphate phosphoketolase
MRLQPADENPRGLSDDQCGAIFGRDKPIVFAFHGYASFIHGVVYRRSNHECFHVCGFMEEGDVTSPFDMRVKNEIDRFHLADTAVTLAAGTRNIGAEIRQDIQRRLIAHRNHVSEVGEDLPEILNWKWTAEM